MKNEKNTPDLNASLVELFQEELKLQLLKLEESLKKLLSEGPLQSVFDQMIRYAHSIKGAAKLINLEPIVVLSNGIEVLFRAYYEKTVSLDDAHLTTLFSCFKLLQILAQCPVSEVKKILKEKNDQFITLSAELESLLLSGYKKVEKSEITTSNKNDNIENFLKNLRIEAKTLVEGISHFREDFEDNEILEEMVIISENIKKLGKSINLSIVIQLGEALETCFRAALNQQLIWTQGHMDLLMESVDFLRRLSDCNPYGMSSWLAKHEKGIEAIACVILAISKEASSIPGRKRDKIDEKNQKKIEQEDVEGNITSESFFHDPTMLDLFYGELEQRVIELNEGILSLENHSNDPKILEGLMRAAHSLKGAARIVDLSLISRLAHALEDFFISLQNNPMEIQENQINELFNAIDFFAKLSQIPYNTIQSWIKTNSNEIESIIQNFSTIRENPSKNSLQSNNRILSNEVKSQDFPKTQKESIKQFKDNKTAFKKETNPKKILKKDSYLRVSATNLNKLMGLAGESLVESRWLVPFSESLIAIRREQHKLSTDFDALYEQVSGEGLYSGIQDKVISLKQQLHESQTRLAERLVELDLFIRRQSSLSDRLYAEVVNSRMRPFADAVEPFPRLVRDLAKQLRKKVNFTIEGKNTSVDREILEKLEAPLNHLLRNAVDHGIEPQAERVAAGKNEVGMISLKAFHKAGMLLIKVSDDGRGVDLESLRKKIVEKGFVSTAIAEKLSESELLEFLFLPGFSTSKEVTEVSGRGIGLNVVQNMVQEVGGCIKAYLDGGLVIELQLPLTLSVIRALMVEISKEVYAFPLARINRVIVIPKNEVYSIKNNHYFFSEGKNIPLIYASQLLELHPPEKSLNTFSVILLKGHSNDYGVFVDRFISEKEIVVQELDPMLGKIQDISGATFMEDGSPVLIVDIEDMIRSIEKGMSEEKIELNEVFSKKKIGKKILIIDDSLTVREAESKLLQNEGYIVDTVVDGLAGWNAIQTQKYDLIITDIDMPRMNGIELIKTIRADPRYKNIPIIIVTYKENEKDRIAGLEVGASYYLTKNSFQDEGLLNIVYDLIENNRTEKK